MVPREGRRIAVVTHGFLPLVGGAETHHALGIDGLPPQHYVRVFTSKDCLPAALARFPTTRTVELEHRRVTVTYLPSIRILNEKVIHPISLARELLAFHPDVIWTNEPAASAFIAALVGRLLRTRWAVTYHADLQQDRFARRAFTRVEANLLRHASGIEVSTVSMAETLARRGVRRERVTVLTPPLWPDRIDLRKGKTFEETVPRLDENPPLILFVGGLDQSHEYKRPDNLIRALHRVSLNGIPFRAILVGSGDRQGELERLSHDLGMKNIIHFAGRVPDDQLVHYYREAACLVIPSEGASEGFGLVVFEALSWGCPVVASTDVPAASDPRCRGAVLQFASGDIDALAESLKEILLNPTVREDLRQHAREIDISQINAASQVRLCEFILGDTVSDRGGGTYDVSNS